MALLSKLASSFNSDFCSLLSTGEHLFTCQNVRQGGEGHCSVSGYIHPGLQVWAFVRSLCLLSPSSSLPTLKKRESLKASMEEEQYHGNWLCLATVPCTALVMGLGT
jgi:hypothetical protein